MGNFLGYSVYVDLALPATNNAAGFEALTWVKVNGLVQLPRYGVEHDTIEIPDLTTGFGTAVKGMGRGVSSTLMFRDVPSDSGQTDLKSAAQDEDGLCSLKIVRGTGADNAPASGDLVIYLQGFAHSLLPNEGSGTAYEGFQVGYRQTHVEVIATEPA